MALQSDLMQLQIDQLQHDEKYAREITYLNIHNRLVHMVLHLAKYNAKIIVDNAIAVIDSFIICTSMANFLNIRISDYFDCNYQTVPELCESLKTDWPTLHKRFAMSVGSFAKITESLDHLEAVPYRKLLTEELKEMFSVILALAHFHGLDLENNIKTRRETVQSRSIFHDR